MKPVIAYKVEFYDGPLNGGIRFYKSLSTARRVAKSYVTRNRDYPENVGYDIFEMYSDYTTRRIESR